MTCVDQSATGKNENLLMKNGTEPKQNWFIQYYQGGEVHSVNAIKFNLEYNLSISKL